MTPISKEKRELIIKHKQNKKTESQIAEWLDSSESTLKIIAKMEEQPDITLLELIDERSLDISESGLSRLLKNLDFTLKKRRFIQKNKSERM